MQDGSRCFREVYCQKTHCDSRRFRRRVFWRCLYPHALFITPVLLLAEPELFAPDLDLIKEVGEAVDIEEAAADINAFLDTCKLNGGLLHQHLRIRISGKKLLHLAATCI